MNKYYLTSAIPYVNAAPHIGHAQEFVYSDTIRRYHKLLGQKVTYLCGPDENGLKIVQAAEKEDKPTSDFCDYYQQKFLELADKLNVQFDIWQRSSDKKTHFASSQYLWNLCQKNGDIYKKTYTGLYCVGCETFYTPDELDIKGECTEHPGKKLEKVSEENYFFRLSRYQDFLEDLISKDKLKIIPKYRKNEALGFIKRGLLDFSVSRSKTRAKDWGIPVPDDSSQIIYVWFDALNVYFSGIGLGWDEKRFKEYAPQDLMVIGKGILRFHAIYWPVILKSAGLPLPKELYIHGYLTVDGQKMSKTVGNVIDPLMMINKYGTDGLRYYLLREIPSYGDGDFSERRFKELYNSDLANGLGNLVARVAKLCEQSGLIFPQEKERNKTLEKQIFPHLDSFQFNSALAVLWEQVNKYNIYIDQHAPWKLIKENNQKETKEVLTYLVDGIRILSKLLSPFLPKTAELISNQYNREKISFLKPLFPRIP